MSDRICPVDGVALVEVNYRDVVVDQCPTCRGIFCDPGELETIVEQVARPLAMLRQQQDRLNRISITNPAMTQRAKTPRFCPVDGASLEPYEIMGVAVDICPLCFGIWLDAGELEMIISLAACYLAHHGDKAEISTAPIPFGDYHRDRSISLSNGQAERDQNFVAMLSERSRHRAKGVYELDMPTSTPRTVNRHLRQEQAAFQLSRKTQEDKLVPVKQLLRGYNAYDVVDTGGEIIDTVQTILEAFSE